MLAQGQTWWRGAVFYEICPRSFADSNGDGVGDLRGIADHLGYVADLGVDAVWLTPFYASPAVDFGYDVSDHCAVDPALGTLADFDVLLQRAHELGLRVLVDFVANHTSDRHPWFESARQDRTARFRDFYIWADGRPGGEPPNNWLSSFHTLGSAWAWDPASAQFYLHSFAPQQPDLNWHNPDVSAAMAGVLRFWLERGVDGFRVDAPHHLVKDPALADNPDDLADRRDALGPGADRLRHIDQPGVHDVLRSLRRTVAHYGADRVLLGEVGVGHPGRWGAYLGAGDELDLIMDFRFWSQPWSAERFAASMRTALAALGEAGWPVFALGNHDIPRLITRFGDGDASDGNARARVAALLLLTLPGSPLLYYGDELGMAGVEVPPGRAVDVAGRDPARTPMQWSSAPNAGFCPPDVAPWLPVGPELDTVSVVAQDDDPASLLTLYRRLLQLRRAEPALSAGSCTAPSAVDDVCTYERRRAGTRLFVALNFAGAPRTVPLPAPATTLLSTSCHDTPASGAVSGLPTSGPLHLQPDQGVVLRLGDPAPGIGRGTDA